MSSNPALSLADTNLSVNPSRNEDISVTNLEDANMKMLQNIETCEKNEHHISSNIKSSSKTKLNVKIRAWNGVATWKWIANDDTCGICRVAFDGCCPDCKLPGDDCPLVWGACTHCFHIHCIMKWLNSQQAQHLCPMCRQDWKFKE